MIRRKLSDTLGIAVTASLILLSQYPLAAVAGTLAGKVTDKSSGEALPGATVLVKLAGSSEGTRGMATEDDGSYVFKDMAAGEYVATVRSVGFVTKEIPGITIMDGNNETTLDAILVPVPINTGAITITSSRRPEKVLETPASVTVVGLEEVQARTVLATTEYVKGLPAVDVASNGLQQANVAVRGFNKIFSGDLLVLTDNRIARVPSLRFNAYDMIPTVSSDIEQIEMVSGPGAALYGPNSASGVMHIVTRSPFSSQGTTISVGGGERDVVLGSIRHAGVLGERLGYKITGSYQQGSDWRSSDENEPDSVTFFRPTATGPDVVGEPFENRRDFGVKKLSGEGRIDWVADNNTSVILNGGFTRSSSIQLTGIGAVQAIDWIYSFAQARLRHKNLFVQGFVNMSDAGDTYALRTGQLLIDKSRLWSGQIQHSAKPHERVSLTYGFDALFTRPNTESTVNGGNEEIDNVNEYGVYGQADVRLTEKVSFVGAARLDDHSMLKDMVFSPRAGLVFKPNDRHNLRLTYNRAFDTPDNNDLFLDILQAKDPFGVGASFSPSFGFAPNIDIRASGVPETGWNWNVAENGVRFRSPFAPLGGLTTSDYIPMDDPVFTNVMWGAGRGAVLAGFAAELAAKDVPQGTIDALSASLSAVAPSTVSGVTNTLMTFDTELLTFVPSDASDIADIDRLRPTITQTIEIGGKGVVSGRLRYSIDGYRTEKHDFIGPLTIETPNVFLDPTTLGGYLGTEFGQALADPGNADHATTLAALDGPEFGGNGNGTVVDELTTMFTGGAARIPFGTVTPEEATDPTALLVTYRNFGNVSLYGTDLALDYHLGRNWNVGGTYSYVSRNIFKKSATQVHDILLNSPRHKFSARLQHSNARLGLNTNARVRFVDAFDMDSPYPGTTVESYTIADFNVAWEFLPGTSLALTVQNILDNKHVEFIGGPEIGRLTLLRVTRSL